MTVFNGESHLREAIDSILSQTFRDFEFIIVDNASTDGTKSIISSLKDPRIIFIENQENLGQTKALNIGIRHSKGEYIARMDADDVSYPQRLQKQYEYISKHDSIAVVGTRYVEIDEKGRNIRHCYVLTDPLEIKSYLSSSGELSYHRVVPHPAVLMRRTAVLDVGLYDERLMAQDYDFWIRLSRKYYFTNLKKVLFKYRIVKNSQTQKFQEILSKEAGEIIKGNIKHHCPYLGDSQMNSLWCMLNFLPQDSRQQGENVLELFDDFFEKVMISELKNRKVQKIKQKIKLYYLPKLFLTNPALAVKTAFSIISIQPTLLLNTRVYHKVVKTFLNGAP